MAIKPIIEVQHRGKRVRVQFAQQRGMALRYDILVNDKPIKISVFAEEVMRWLASELCQEPASRRTT
jgi:predicted hydrolase (HD superfamily)